ncbi:MAG: hypothetical protein M4579_005330 [Chaenotheca gracillima]|nr:MAG: hypothetical protein M4579_005330 [Chaenotheca gracillima]
MSQVNNPTRWICSADTIKVASSALSSFRASTSSLAAAVNSQLKQLTASSHDPDSFFSLSSAALGADSLTSPNLLYTAAAVFVTLVAVSMTGWGKQYWGGGGRLSPVGPVGHPPRVTDEDFSYITTDDIPNDDSHPYSPSRSDQGPDVIYLRKGGHSHTLKFPNYSIDRNRLTVGDVREEAAKTLKVSDPSRLKLFYKGRILKDDYRTCREEGLAMLSELMCVGTDDSNDRYRHPVPGQGAGSDARSESDEDTSTTGETSTKKKRRGGKKKKSKKPLPQSAGTSSSNLVPPGSGLPGGSRAPSPAPPPKTPLEKLEGLSSFFRTELLPPSLEFTARPPTDPVKREHEHKKLTETILSQVLIKLDGVETDGDAEIRQRRKDLVKEVQSVLNGLDAMKEHHS